MAGEIVLAKFQEWTDGMNQRDASISVYDHIRDIPYAVVHGRNPETAQEEMLMQNKGSCTAKHTLLSDMFEKLGIGTRYVSHIFSWTDLSRQYPKDLAELALQMPHSDHLFCQAHIDGDWVNVDATWDSALKNSGFPVNEYWNGISDQNTAVKHKTEIVHDCLEDRTILKKMMMDNYTPAQNAIQPVFYARFNEWLDSLRIKD
jgi:hypothetical protein